MSQIIKQYIKDLKSKSKCCICGESENCCLEFHHIGHKNFSIGKIPHTVTLDEVKDEITRTICVCANCHRKLHNNIIKYEGIA